MPMKITKYFLNCFLLLMPIFLWNILLVDYLPTNYSPDVFGKYIPELVSTGESILRIIVFVLPVLMILSIKTRLQRLGFICYLVGLVLYFLSWLVLIVFPECNWSQSLIGFMAPAFTTIVWFIGIALIGHKSFIKVSYLPQVYIVLSFLFVLFHSAHTYISFQNL